MTVDLSAIAVVDGHGHPLLRDPVDVSIGTFLDLFSEGRAGTMREHVMHTGYYRRALRTLAERLGVDATAEAVLKGRRRHPGSDTARAQFAAAGIAALLVDTGYPADGGMPFDEMRRRLGCAVHEVFRIETCAERLLIQRLPFDEFMEAFRRALLDAATGCVAFKTIVAYRSGLAVRRWRDDECRASYARTIAAIPPSGRPRLADKPRLDRLVQTTLDVPRETGRPLQVHAGFGDPDIGLLGASPLHLRPISDKYRVARGSTRRVRRHSRHSSCSTARFDVPTVNGSAVCCHINPRLAGAARASRGRWRSGKGLIQHLLEGHPPILPLAGGPQTTSGAALRQGL